MLENVQFGPVRYERRDAIPFFFLLTFLRPRAIRRKRHLPSLAVVAAAAAAVFP
jgi:hypothetical protein